MSIKTDLVDLLLKIKSSLKGIMGIAPLLLGWSSNSLKHNPSTTLVLVLWMKRIIYNVKLHLSIFLNYKKVAV